QDKWVALRPDTHTGGSCGRAGAWLAGSLTGRVCHGPAPVANSPGAASLCRPDTCTRPASEFATLPLCRGWQTRLRQPRPGAGAATPDSDSGRSAIGEEVCAGVICG